MACHESGRVQVQKSRSSYRLTENICISWEAMGKRQVGGYMKLSMLVVGDLLSTKRNRGDSSRFCII